ncbi:MAG: protease inhibitor I42 family protein [Rhodopseudomonas palustris]|uniref:Protease inhibitor I42 family protein n=1 Tax=Rhodopseudomonas palustris TaxID=1076 RepID=A0A933W2C2_RHOPL|nr:protease inhibitor I42 family protein [Rhodopseudomonas palustris]
MKIPLVDSFKPLRRTAAIAALLLIAIATPSRAEDSAETLRLAPGEAASFAIKENPSTGYRWHLDPTESRNLDLVDISDAGFTDAGGKPLIGAPGQRHFRVTARKAGTASIVLDYLRDWENVPPASRHTVTVEIAPR